MSSSTLALIQAAPMARGAKNAKPSKKDKERYLLSRRGWTLEAIAGREGVKELAVKDSILRYQLYRDSLDVAEGDLHISEMIERVMPKAEKVLTDAMKAEHTINVGRGQKVIMKKVADYATRLEGVKTFKSFVDTVRPKGGGITVNTQVNNGKGDGTTPQTTRGFDFEARLRDIRERKGMVSADEVQDAEFDEDSQSTAAEELADIGIDIDEDEDDGDFDEDNDEE